MVIKEHDVSLKPVPNYGPYKYPAIDIPAVAVPNIIINKTAVILEDFP